MIEDRYLKIDVCHKDAHVFMRITHIPTGIVVQGDGSQPKALKQDLIKQLEKKISQ